MIHAADHLQGSRSAGINEAIDVLGRGLKGGQQHVLQLPPGEHRITETIRFGGWQVHESQYGLVVRGAGSGARYHVPGQAGVKAPSGGTVLRWEGPANEPMVEIVGVRHARFEDFELWGGDEALVGLDLRASGSAITTDNLFSNIAIFGCTVGLRIAGDPIGDASSGGSDQVDHCTFLHLKMRDCGVSLWHQSSQAVAHHFIDCKLAQYHHVGAMVCAGMPNFTTCYWSPKRGSGHTTGLYVGSEANIVTLDGLGHWELEPGGIAIRGSTKGAPAQMNVLGQNFLKMDPGDGAPLCEYARRGTMLVQGCRFDGLGAPLDVPGVWSVRSPARLVWNANTEKLRITQEED